MRVGRETIGQAVDSSATMRTPGFVSAMESFKCRRSEIASRFSLPP